jgi:hypothetical protein
MPIHEIQHDNRFVPWGNIAPAAKHFGHQCPDDDQVGDIEDNFGHFRKTHSVRLQLHKSVYLFTIVCNYSIIAEAAPVKSNFPEITMEKFPYEWT